MNDKQINKLIKFFETYKKVFREGMSTSDADDVLYELMDFFLEEDADSLIVELRKKPLLGSLTEEQERYINEMHGVN